MAMRFVTIGAPDSAVPSGPLEKNPLQKRPLEESVLLSEDGRAFAAARSLTALLVGRRLAEVERDLILDTLVHCHGNRTQAAALLGISIRTLRNKLKLYSDAGAEVPAPGEIGQGPTGHSAS